MLCCRENWFDCPLCRALKFDKMEYKDRKENYMNENFFAYISRMRYITRWSLMRNSYSENIQEHSTWWPCWPMPWR